VTTLGILGAGGHGQVVADIATVTGEWDTIQFYDDRPNLVLDSVPWLLVGGFEQMVSDLDKLTGVIVAIGCNRTRLELICKLEAAGAHLPTLVHPSAIVSHHVTLGAGSVCCAGVIVNIASRVGRGCILNSGAVIEHHCQLGEGVHICPGVKLGGGVTAGDRTMVGIGASVIQKISIGADVTVGGGAVIIRDITDGLEVVGNPGRIIHAPVVKNPSTE